MTFRHTIKLLYNTSTRENLNLIYYIIKINIIYILSGQLNKFIVYENVFIPALKNLYLPEVVSHVTLETKLSTDVTHERTFKFTLNYIYFSVLCCIRTSKLNKAA